MDSLIDLHRRNPRQGPGSDAETCRALDLARLDHAAPLAIADVGCGTGASTIVLAEQLSGTVHAIDMLPAFIDALRLRADALGLADRIRAQVGEMGALPFTPESLDLLRSEGAIYNNGFEAGIAAWRTYLRPGGVLAVSELTWTTDRRPAAVESHWHAEYPQIATASAKLGQLEASGYEPLGFFFLPATCWREGYYQPLRDEFDAFLARHGRTAKATSIIDAERREAQLYDDFGQWYSYGFYIARKRDDLPA